MIYTENNWHTWQYGDEPPLGRRSIMNEFRVNFSQYSGDIMRFGDELKKTARSTIDHFPGEKPCIIFFGNGLDAELMLRTYIDIGIIPNVYIFKYEDDINISAVNAAIDICNALSIRYNLIDFNLKKFLQNDVEDLIETAQIDFIPLFASIKYIDYVDGFPIFNYGMEWTRRHRNFSIPGEWYITCYEGNTGIAKYANHKGMNVVTDWFMWSPSLVLSYMNSEWFNLLINDEYHGKLATYSTKINLYKAVYDDIIDRHIETKHNEGLKQLYKDIELNIEKKYNVVRFSDSINISFREFLDIIHVDHNVKYV